MQRVGEGDGRISSQWGRGWGGTSGLLEHLLYQKIKMAMLLLTFIANKTIIKVVSQL